MSKKRGPNSPMESEKTKHPSTSAAATTLGFAAVMSAVSGVFSNQEASSVVSDSDSDEEPAQTNETVNNPWNAANLSNSQVKSPRRPATRVEPLFHHHHEGSMRDEIEVEVQTKNKKKFTGSITPIEAKHQMYINGLKFDDHSNFDGVRIGFKGKLVVTFKLIQPINIDELDAVEYFDFVRTATVNGRRVEEVIGCRVKGIRYRPMMISSLDNVKPDDGAKIVKIEGCEYRVNQDEILQWLSHYGEITSSLEEDCFRDDHENSGTNRTGNYSVMMKLDRPIPQLIPMCGRRVKIYHAGIQKLCTKCFGPHKKQFCQSADKVPWIAYVKSFIEDNEDVQPELFGKWIELVQRVDEESKERTLTQSVTQTSRHEARPDQPLIPANIDQQTTSSHQIDLSKEVQKDSTPEPSIAENQSDRPPTEQDFDIPTSEANYESMIERFKTVGLTKKEADEAIKARTTAFNRACREFKKKQLDLKKRDGSKSSTRANKSTPKNNQK